MYTLYSEYVFTMISTNDTICALATAPGVGGLAVIRVSGPQAFALVDKLFHARTKISDAASHTIVYGKLRRAVEAEGETEKKVDLPSGHTHSDTLDTVTCSVFRAPHSYTGEDVVEIGCHGGEVVPQMIIAALLDVGARLARPGEFTQRAFVNGKLDLTQVESVADLIHASSEAGARVAGRQLLGAFKENVRSMRSRLIDLCAFLELELDFAQEDVEFVSREKLIELIDSVAEFCDNTARGYQASVVLRSGYKVAFVGKPNAGKSSLYNALLGFDRSIVHNVAGTTRDYIQESVMWDGLRFQLCDTAGMRTSNDIVEVEGMERGSAMISESHMIIVVHDFSTEDRDAMKIVDEIVSTHPHKHVVLVYNKCDVAGSKGLGSSEVSNTIPVISLSAKTGHNVATLREYICRVARSGSDIATDVLLNDRHMYLLQQTQISLSSARAALDADAFPEAIAYELRRAVDTLGEFTGEVINEDIINAVFAGFCIGK